MRICLDLQLGTNPSGKFKPTSTCSLPLEGHKYILPEQTPLQGTNEYSGIL